MTEIDLDDLVATCRRYRNGSIPYLMLAEALDAIGDKHLVRWARRHAILREKANDLIERAGDNPSKNTLRRVRRRQARMDRVFDINFP